MCIHVYLVHIPMYTHTYMNTYLCIHITICIYVARDINKHCTHYTVLTIHCYTAIQHPYKHIYIYIYGPHHARQLAAA